MCAKVLCVCQAQLRAVPEHAHIYQALQQMYMLLRPEKLVYALLLASTRAQEAKMHMKLSGKPQGCMQETPGKYEANVAMYPPATTSGCIAYQLKLSAGQPKHFCRQLV